MRILVCLVFLAAPAIADTIKTKDGVTHTGRVLSEMERGYLFRSAEGGTFVIEFGQVDDIQRDGPPPPVSDAPARVPLRAVESTPALEPSVSVTRHKLQLQLQELRFERSEISYFFPGALTVVGAGLIIGASPLTYSGSADTQRNAFLLVAGGCALAVTGAVLLIVRIINSRNLGMRIEDVERALALER